MTPRRLRPKATAPSSSETDRFERLFREHYDAVLAYALARANTDLAKDAVSQTFLVAWRRRHELPRAPRGWLLGVARRSLADLRRSRDRQLALGARLHLLDDTYSDVGDTAEIVTQRDAVQVALAQLSSSDAELLKLISWDGLNHREAAQSLGCTTATLAVRLHRARLRFEQVFDPQEISTPRQAPSQEQPATTPSTATLTREAQ